jgi:pimeloyl-ACP methyl ester carboxylesterase
MLIQANGVRIFALEAGQGSPPLVFVHGNGGDHTAWHKQIAYFSPITRVIAIDLRGFGGSSKDPNGAYTQENFAKDVVAVLEAGDVRNAILLGWSLAGSVVARVAVEHPDRVAAIGLVDANVNAAAPELGLKLDPRYTTEALIQGLEDDFEGRGFRTMIDSWFPEEGPDIDFLKQALWETGVRYGRDVIFGIRVASNRSGPRQDPRVWLDQLKVPVCILQGGDSYLGGRKVADYLAQILPHARKHVFDGHGHGLFMTAPDEFNAALHDFWREVAAKVS